MPQGVSYCSVRGSLGWPDLSRTDRNLDAIGAFAEDLIAKEEIRLGHFHHHHDDEEE